MIRVAIKPSLGGVSTAGCIALLNVFASIGMFLGSIAMFIFQDPTDPKIIVYLICAVILPNAAIMAVIILG